MLLAVDGADGLMLEAFKTEPLLHALAGVRLVLFAALFLVVASLRCRALACVLVLLFRIVYFALFGSLASLCSSSWLPYGPRVRRCCGLSDRPGGASRLSSLLCLPPSVPVEAAH